VGISALRLAEGVAHGNGISPNAVGSHFLQDEECVGCALDRTSIKEPLIMEGTAALNADCEFDVLTERDSLAWRLADNCGRLEAHTGDIGIVDRRELGN